MGVVEMVVGGGCLVWIPAFAGMTVWVGWVGSPFPLDGGRLGWG